MATHLLADAAEAQRNTDSHPSGSRGQVFGHARAKRGQGAVALAVVEWAQLDGPRIRPRHYPPWQARGWGQARPGHAGVVGGK